MQLDWSSTQDSPASVPWVLRSTDMCDHTCSGVLLRGSQSGFYVLIPLGRWGVWSCSLSSGPQRWPQGVCLVEFPFFFFNMYSVNGVF